MISMIAAQMAEQASKEDQNPHKVKEFEDQAAQYITAAVKGKIIPLRSAIPRH